MISVAFENFHITQLTDAVKIFCANMLEYKLFSPSF